jgi:hypothetical protein
MNLSKEEKISFYRSVDEASPGLIKRGINNRQSLQRRETEDYYREELSKYRERSSKYWNRDYRSIDAFLKSVEVNRKRWLETVGDYETDEKDLAAETEPFWETEHFLAKWITVKVFKNLRGRAILALPKGRNGKVPLVICQHGAGSAPEWILGFDDPDDDYHAFGRKLAEHGFAVLAPLNITEGAPLARYTRLALLLGKTLWGLEIFKIRRLLDYALSLPEIDSERVAMWGLSLGGAYTLFTPPLEPRIKVGIIGAWFNDRFRKMVIEDPRYSCWLPIPNSEHAFIPGWLREFSDSDLISLICPRPIMIQTGKCDSIAWWPFVLEEFERAKEHYRKLGLEERIEIDLHEGGHEIRFDSGFRFLRKWLIDKKV